MSPSEQFGCYSKKTKNKKPKQDNMRFFSVVWRCWHLGVLDFNLPPTGGQKKDGPINSAGANKTHLMQQIQHRHEMTFCSNLRKNPKNKPQLISHRVQAELNQWCTLLTFNNEHRKVCLQMRTYMCQFHILHAKQSHCEMIHQGESFC